MKKLIMGAAVGAVCITAARRFAPALAQGAMHKCEGKCEDMFDRMPEDCPPKRFMRTTDESLDQKQADQAASPTAGTDPSCGQSGLAACCR